MPDHTQDLIENQEAIISKTQQGLLSVMESGNAIDGDTTSVVVRLSQALAVQIDKLMTLRAVV